MYTSIFNSLYGIIVNGLLLASARAMYQITLLVFCGDGINLIFVLILWRVDCYYPTNRSIIFQKEIKWNFELKNARIAILDTSKLYRGSCFLPCVIYAIRNMQQMTRQVYVSYTWYYKKITGTQSYRPISLTPLA